MNELVRTRITIQLDDFDPGLEFKSMIDQKDFEIGGLVTFIGLVRDISSDKNLKSMELEHYPDMTERALQNICNEAKSKWCVRAITIIHSIGVLYPGDKIVYVSVASSHRNESFQAVEFIMDFLKSRAPFWKKEITKRGCTWVDARTMDETALNRWK